MNTTLLYYTGHLPPESFLNRIRGNLLEEADELPIVSVSHQPVNLGTNISIGEQRKCFYTAQKQILIGLDQVITKYVVFCEDDTLYTYDHLHWIPPEDDTFYYNVNRWTCEPQFYWWASRMNQSQLICNTDLAKSYFNKRFQLVDGPDDPKLANFQEPGRTKSRYDRMFGFGAQKAIRVEIGDIPLVVFNLKTSLRGIRRVAPNSKKTDTLPHWGNCRDLFYKFTGKTLMEIFYGERKFS
jgi:hypothetical protein